MITGSAPTGSSTPPICAAALRCTRAADLRARSDERVRVDQRLVADVGADVDVHRRHADDAAAEVGAVPDGRSAGHDAHAGPRADRLQRQRVLVEERPAAVIGRHVDGLAEAESEQDAALHPGVHPPAGRATTDRAPRRERCRRTARRAAARTPCRASSRGASAPAATSRSMISESPAGVTRERPRRGRATAGPRRSAASTPDAAAPSADDTPLRAAPCVAIALFTGNRIGLDEVHQQQRQQPLVQRARAGEVSALGRARRGGSSRAGISFDATEMMPRPPTAISGSVSASSPDRTMKSSGTRRADLAHLRHVARRFLHADDVRDRAQANAAWPDRRCSRCGPARCRR